VRTIRDSRRSARRRNRPGHMRGSRVGVRHDLFRSVLRSEPLWRVRHRMRRQRGVLRGRVSRVVLVGTARVRSQLSIRRLRRGELRVVRTSLPDERGLSGGRVRRELRRHAHRVRARMYRPARRSETLRCVRSPLRVQRSLHRRGVRGMSRGDECVRQRLCRHGHRPDELRRMRGAVFGFRDVCRGGVPVAVRRTPASCGIVKIARAGAGGARTHR
jgi:hypothetical protein